MPTVQVLPPANGPLTIEVFGRKFTTTAGTPISVNDNEANILAANGWIICALGGHGPTSGRPTNPKKNDRYTDTTVGSDLVWDGAAWRHVTTGASS